MKKNYFSLIGFAVILIINYALSHYIKQDFTENLNNIDFYKILKQSLHPPFIFLFIIFFSRNSLRATTFTLFIFGYMIIEFIFRYFNEKDIFEYNYIIGMIVGLILVFLIDWIKEKIVINKK
ncbi:hypothetical protein [uncultured Lutibacter sp.]|uniref:hypothetical protein n=1 Tax=uncultured Lutibacter sp. TaxID=437739 RepID=UPI0026177CE3|nr:hypothetical protein [uncultured Lutibacter sp.]